MNQNSDDLRFNSQLQESFIDDPSISERMIAENELGFAFLGKMPIVPGHTLVCPKRMVARSKDLTIQEWNAILNLKELVLCLKNS